MPKPSPHDNEKLVARASRMLRRFRHGPNDAMETYVVALLRSQRPDTKEKSNGDSRK